MSKTIARLFLIVVFITMGVGVLPAAAQSCTPRTDWIPYRVAYGDTLFRIAVRTRTTLGELSAGNCITNPNLIFVGQVLRVRPGLNDSPRGTVHFTVNFQQFERGFMIWYPDVGDIWVYFGQSGSRVSRFLVRNYSRLPDNPVSTVPPAGRIRPIFGFGKVWGNYPLVRAALGWATSHEQSYVMQFSDTNSGVFYASLPDGRRVVVTPSFLWGVYTPQGTGGASVITTNAAYQLFENGFLLWREDTGRIEEFHRGFVAGYNLDQYANLPDNPVTDLPPAGRVKPVFGFGRVWGNYPATRNALGWGLGHEQGYVATFHTSDDFINCVNLPDGRFISYPHFDGVRSYTWREETSCG